MRLPRLPRRRERSLRRHAAPRRRRGAQVARLGKGLARSERPGKKARDTSDTEPSNRPSPAHTRGRPRASSRGARREVRHRRVQRRALRRARASRARDVAPLDAASVRGFSAASGTRSGDQPGDTRGDPEGSRRAREGPAEVHGRRRAERGADAREGRAGGHVGTQRRGAEGEIRGESGQRGRRVRGRRAAQTRNFALRLCG